MLRAMFSAVSGMRSHMSYMDVVGNNIANVNTVAYKSARVTFQDVLAQTLSAGGAPTADLGGTNPVQIGLGMKLGGVSNLMQGGAPQSTGKLTDFAIQGSGFFVLFDGETQYFSRDGAFDLDEAGDLVNPANGLRVQGWMANAGVVDTTGALETINIPLGETKDPLDPTTPKLVSFAVSASGEITGVYADGTSEHLATLAVANFVNPGAMLREGQNLWSSSANSGAPDIGEPNSDGRGTIWTGTLEGSNVDLAAEFTHLILAQRGFQANSRVISASDQVLQDLVNIIR
ncbi:MAG: flagellar hook-basal body complex protein [Dehalococcoidia bacterium]|nr:flagellar hook-basal body complex protein [Dehalococcoidia bacterium]